MSHGDYKVGRRTLPSVTIEPNANKNFMFLVIGNRRGRNGSEKASSQAKTANDPASESFHARLPVWFRRRIVMVICHADYQT
jgi:hypothetical protein